MNKCFEGLVGMRNVCGGSETIYYLDDIGISLNMASKAVDSKYINGSEMVTRKLQQAWREALNDVTLQGFELKKVICDKTYGRTSWNTSTLTNGTGVITLTRVGSPDQTSIYIGSIIVDGSGVFTLTINDGETSFNYIGSEDVVNVRKTFSGKVVTITISYTTVKSGTLGVLESLCNCAGCDVIATGSANFGLRLDVQQVCDRELYLCRYAELIAEAVMYKAGALILKELMDTDRVNDFLIMKETNLLVNMAYLDSLLNITAIEEGKKPNDGKYQQVMARISKEVAAPKKSCCVTCKGGSYNISLP